MPCLYRQHIASTLENLCEKKNSNEAIVYKTRNIFNFKEAVVYIIFPIIFVAKFSSLRIDLKKV